jgi:hypothetical protein
MKKDEAQRRLIDRLNVKICDLIDENKELESSLKETRLNLSEEQEQKRILRHENNILKKELEARKQGTKDLVEAYKNKERS